MTLLVKYPGLDDVYILTYNVLAQTSKTVSRIIEEEMPKGKQVFVHHDPSLRAYWITLNPHFTPIGI